MHGLVVRYPGTRGRAGTASVTAVAGVDLDVPAGQVLALLGPSGCGKSSLLRAVAGLEPSTAGVVRWAGADLRSVPVHRRGFGLVFQDGQLFPHRDVSGNVGYGLARGPARARRVAELLDLVGLPGYQRRPVATLSGGERQRVALARSLAPSPRLLLLDEPLSALDRSLRERLADDLRAVLVATGTTALFVTHDQDEAFTVADRVAVMSAGRLLQVAPPEELWRRPADREVAEFLGYRTFLRGPGTPGPLVGVAPGGWRVLGGAARRAAAEPDPGTTDAGAASSRPGAGAGAGAGAAVVPVASDGGAVVREGTVTGRRTRRGRLEVVADLRLLPADAPEAGAGASAGAGPVSVTAALPAGVPLPEPGTRVHLIADQGSVATLDL
ncbi:MAG TPA: ABC transporter ATP-binding protein [Cellulomonas sp.]